MENALKSLIINKNLSEDEILDMLRIIILDYP